MREFSRDVSKIFETIRVYDDWNAQPHVNGEIPPYIGIRNSYTPGGDNKFVQKFSMYEYRDGVIKIRTDYENLIKTFCVEVVKKHTKMSVDWSFVNE